MRSKLVLLALGLPLGACAEATYGDELEEIPSETVPDDSAATTEKPSSSKPSKKTGRPDKATGGPKVLVSEIAASDEWIEIVNAGDAPVEIAGWKVADLDRTKNEPKIDEAGTFEAGTVLAPGERAIVMGGGAEAKPCPGGGETICIRAEFGVSKSKGETIFLLDGDSAVVDSVDLPPNAGAEKDESWCLVPDSSPRGQFALCTQSGGAPNAQE